MLPAPLQDEGLRRSLAKRARLGLAHSAALSSEVADAEVEGTLVIDEGKISATSNSTAASGSPTSMFFEVTVSAPATEADRTATPTAQRAATVSSTLVTSDPPPPASEHLTLTSASLDRQSSPSADSTPCDQMQAAESSRAPMDVSESRSDDAAEGRLVGATDADVPNPNLNSVTESSHDCQLCDKTFVTMTQLKVNFIMDF